LTITTYAGLIAQVPVWLDNDTGLTSVIPDMVVLCEAKLNRKLRSRRQVTRSTISPSAETLAVPADFLAAKTMKLVSGSKWELEFVSVEKMEDLQASDQTTDEPKAFTVEGGNFVFWPAPSVATDIRLIYYATIPAASGTDNWVLANHPDAYLYGTVAEAWSYKGNGEEAAKFGQLFLGVIDSINASSVSESAADRLTPQPYGSVA
jgi:hypothetical protein